MADVVELIGADRIAARVRELAGEIAEAWRREGPRGDLVALVVLKGAFVFAADLLRALSAEGTTPPVDFLRIRSYGDGSESTGDVRFEMRPHLPLRGREVLLLDDILDTGHSLAAVLAWLEEEGVARVRTCVLLDKPGRRAVDVTVDFRGFEVPDRFLVGYGLDYAERHRTLPYVGAVDA